MSEQLAFFVDITKCTGCKDCQIACKDKNQLPEGINGVASSNMKVANGSPRMGN